MKPYHRPAVEGARKKRKRFIVTGPDGVPRQVATRQEAQEVAAFGTVLRKR